MELRNRHLRSMEAAKVIIKGLNPKDPKDASEMLSTLEKLAAFVLLATARNDRRKAAAILNERLAPNTEDILSGAWRRRMRQPPISKPKGGGLEPS